MEKPVRIAKILSRAGVASRRQAEVLIRSGQVVVNDMVILEPSTKVRGVDKIKVFGEPLGRPGKLRLWRYYKPQGLVTTTSDERGRPNIFDRFPKDLPRVMPIGRLDIASEGLLLLTNDGGLKRKFELPASRVLREYRVRANGIHHERKIKILRNGIKIGNERFRPMQVSFDNAIGTNSWYTVGLYEGRNREIRRAFAEIDLKVNRLIRIGFGPFKLGKLLKGEIEEVSTEVLDPVIANL